MSTKKQDNSATSFFSRNFKEMVSKKKQKDVADIIGVSKETIRAWKNGTNMPNAAQLLKMAQEFHISIDWLLLGKPVAEKEHEALKGVDSQDMSSDKTDKLIDHMDATIKLLTDQLNRAQAEIDDLKRKLDPMENQDESLPRKAGNQ